MIAACLRYQHNGPVSQSIRGYAMEGPNLMLRTSLDGPHLLLPMLALKDA